MLLEWFYGVWAIPFLWELLTHEQVKSLEVSDIYQYCGCWCPGAKTPSHQQSQCRLSDYFMLQFHKKNIIILEVNTFRDTILLVEKWSSHLRVNYFFFFYHGMLWWFVHRLLGQSTLFCALNRQGQMSRSYVPEALWQINTRKSVFVSL